MKSRTLSSLVQNGKFAIMLRIGRNIKHYYRITYVVSAKRNGILDYLAKKPSSFEQITKEFSSEPESTLSIDALKSWLDLGIHLGEIKYAKEEYSLSGYSKKLSIPDNDPIMAMLEEIVFLHSKLIIDTPDKIRQGASWSLEDQDGEMIARSSRVIEPFQTEAIDLFFPEKGSVRLLEIGCGSGYYVKYAAQNNPDLTAVCLELQQDVAKMARNNFKVWGIGSRAVVEEKDIRDKEPDEKFDIITLYNNIYYFPVSERNKLFRHIINFLKPGGLLLITTCCKGGSLVTDVLDLWGASTKDCGRLPYPDEIKKMLKDEGFADVEARSLIPGDKFYAFAGYRPKSK